MDSQKVIYQNIEKKIFISQQTSINKGYRHFEVL